MSRRVLITGGAGFIGSHLADYLIQQGHVVHVIDNLSTGKLSNISHLFDHPCFHFDEGDVVDDQDLRDVVSQVDVIYHLAAVVGTFQVVKKPISVLKTNITGTERVLEAVADSEAKPHLFFASTSEVYGAPNIEFLSEDSPLVIDSSEHYPWHYAISKITGEAYCQTYAQMFDVKATILRFFNIIGPNQTGKYGMVIPRFIQQALVGEPITIFGDGKHERSFCDVRDVVRILALLPHYEDSIGRILNVGSTDLISIIDLAKLIKELTNSSSEFTFFGYDKVYDENFKDIKRRRPDLTALHQLIPFEYEWNLTATLQDLIRRARELHG